MTPEPRLLAGRDAQRERGDDALSHDILDAEQIGRPHLKPFGPGGGAGGAVGQPHVDGYVAAVVGHLSAQHERLAAAVGSRGCRAFGLPDG